MNNGEGKRTPGQNEDSKAPADDDEVSAEELREAAERAWRSRWGMPGGKPDRTSRDEDDDRKN